MSSIISIIVLIITVVIAFNVSVGIYNVVFHPLRQYPGPLSARINLLSWMYHMYIGDFVTHVTELHQKYGEVVRVAPNELSYIKPQAWRGEHFPKGQSARSSSLKADITGHRTQDGRGDLPKDGRTRRPEPNGTASIVTASDEDHRRMRRVQSHMFSEKALSAQEPLIFEYVSKLISRLHEQANNPETATVDLVRWYNYISFDLLGDLAFGTSFGCLDSDVLHPWIVNVFDSIKDLALFRVAKNFPWPVFAIIRAIASRTVMKGRLEQFAFSSRKARERIEQGATDRVDFMSYILKNNDEKGSVVECIIGCNQVDVLRMTTKEIESNAAILIVAGSETTATFLAGITYNLLRTAEVLKTLTDLTRHTFSNEGDITVSKLQRLEYFSACIEEGFRTYPPVPTGILRETEDNGNLICSRYVPAGTKVCVTQWAAYSSSENFTDPDKFVPERWLKDSPARYTNDKREVLQPFSTGPRNCIGRSLAYAEIRLILARMLWNFDLELQPESKDWISQQKIWIMWAKKPLRVRLSPRQ